MFKCLVKVGQKKRSYSLQHSEDWKGKLYTNRRAYATSVCSGNVQNCVKHGQKCDMIDKFKGVY